MTMKNKHFLINRQQGAALVTSLVFMSILTLLGISAMRSNTLDVKIHNAMMDRANAFQCAEAGLRKGELYIRNATQKLDDTNLGAPPEGSRRVWSRGENTLDNLVNESASWWAANGWSANALSDPDAGVGCAKAAEYVVQSMGSVGNGSGDLSYSALAEKQMSVYKVTSRSEGTSENSSVILQSTYTRQF